MQDEYEQIVQDSKENPEILGLILVGSRGKGFDNAHSDYDVVMVVRDDAADVLKQKYKDTEHTDVAVYSVSEFKKYADWDSPESWDRYSYAHTKILVDKTGELPLLIEEKGRIPQDKLDTFIDWWIDGYVNGVYRSVKCIRNDNQFGAHLEAVNSMLDLLTLVFAMNGRHRPFLGYARKELEAYPLAHLPWPPAEFVQKISQVLTNADLKTQQELLIGIEKMSREMGYGHVFDTWKGKDKWTMTFEK